jgi:hypothetical protein
MPKKKTSNPNCIINNIQSTKNKLISPIMKWTGIATAARQPKVAERQIKPFNFLSPT